MYLHKDKMIIKYLITAGTVNPANFNTCMHDNVYHVYRTNDVVFIQFNTVDLNIAHHNFGSQNLRFSHSTVQKLIQSSVVVLFIMFCLISPKLVQ